MCAAAVKITWKSILTKVQQGQELGQEQLSWAMDQIMSGQASSVMMAAFLMGLHSKTESAQELTYLAEGMLKHSLDIDLPAAAVDIVGTGGDQHNTVNISSMSALVIASAGIPVIKHGNRSSSSSSGSADVLEKLGIHLDLKVEQIKACFDETGIAFLFAQVFHPAMRFVAGVRKELSVPTAFNYLGPLTNPAKVRHSAIGVAHLPVAEKYAQVFQARPDQHALIFRGRDGLDELTVTDLSDYWEVADGQISRGVIDPSDYGIERADLADLRGGDASYNAAIFRAVINNELTGPIRDAVLLNAAAGIAAYWPAAEKKFTDRLAAAYTLANQCLEGGQAKEKLDRWIKISQKLSG